MSNLEILKTSANARTNNDVNDFHVKLAEQELSRLKFREAVKEEFITTNSNGEADLPPDFQRMQAVFVNEESLDNSPLYRIRNPGGRNVNAYAIMNNGKILVSSEKNAKHSLYYYAKLPSLLENDTNHVFEQHFNLYAAMAALMAEQESTFSAEAEYMSVLTLDRLNDQVDKLASQANAR